MVKHSFLQNLSPEKVEALYSSFLEDPTSVDESWGKFFQGFDFARENYDQQNEESTEVIHGDVSQIYKESHVINLINGYRSRGHLFTNTNPVRERRKYTPTLDIENFQLSEKDLDTTFESGRKIGVGKTSLRKIIKTLQEIYCQSIGIEYRYIRNQAEIDWIRDTIEGSLAQRTFSKAEKLDIFEKLNQAVMFENFIHKKFVGQKRFSLEGGESLIPSLEFLIRKGSKLGAEEYVFGMAHRGRLNVLANTFMKTYDTIFNEFYGKDYEDPFFSGDVKYHLGYSSKYKTKEGKEIQLHLAPNPSHLEAVNPVVQGISRAIIDQNYLTDSRKLIPVLIHGDAAIAGQGVVYEVVQMSGLKGYQTGGTIHIIINNQVGFTTNYLDARSSTYCTDVAKTTRSPVLHVNGDDTEALIYAVEVAVEYRQKFQKDVFIDLLCYRKYGHNEGDEPMFTQPNLYEIIAKHENPKQIYLKKLIAEKTLNHQEAEKIETRFNTLLNDRLENAKEIGQAEVKKLLEDEWEGIERIEEDELYDKIDTSYSPQRIVDIAESITSLPEKSFFKKSLKLMEQRKKAIKNNRLDWGLAELLAYGTLLDEEFNVRITGQDVERGTFAHRHAVIIQNNSTEDKYVPLNHIKKNQKGTFDIYNSLLSEYAVMGFEFGYSFTKPYTLNIWEAQFGDFANGAQIVIDQYLTTSELKWNQMNGLMILLPHGYEGQGAEHSNARVERFLSLCSNYNLRINNCSTPASFYHLIRSQLKTPYRKPCVIFTPKSLLRHPKCVSTIEELAGGTFEPVIDDPEIKDKSKVRKVLLCSGKFYFDLIEYREKNKMDDVAIVRLEQFYPLHTEKIKAIFASYKNAKTHAWTQEEPENYGALMFLLNRFTRREKMKIQYYSRKNSAVSATGSPARHRAEHEMILKTSFE